MIDPKVSIIIPVYNGSDYLAEAIDSALSQDYSNIEIIVVNDGSNDSGATEQIAKTYGDKISYFHKENGGVSSALNYGIAEMTGEYFSWLSHDDCYSVHKISDAISLLKDNNLLNGGCIAFTGGHFIDAENINMGDFRTCFEKRRLYSGLDVIQEMLKKGTLNGCCMLIPKIVFDTIGGFNEGLRYNQDALMWYQVFSSGYTLISDNKDNVMYRLHRNQTSKTRRDLLLRDSRVLSEIIAPLFAKLSTKKTNLIKMLAFRHANVDCKDAVDVCIGIGKSHGVLKSADIFSIRCRCVWGKIRNMLKKVYHRLLIK